MIGTPYFNPAVPGAIGGTTPAAITGTTITGAQVVISAADPEAAFVNSADSTTSYLGTFSGLCQFSYNRRPSTGIFSNSNRTASYINFNGGNGSGSVQFATSNTNDTLPPVVLQLNGDGTIIFMVPKTPASAAAAGTAGTITWDSGFIYVCVATNTWKRIAIATW